MAVCINSNGDEYPFVFFRGDNKSEVDALFRVTNTPDKEVQATYRGIGRIELCLLGYTGVHVNTIAEKNTYIVNVDGRAETWTPEKFHLYHDVKFTMEDLADAAAMAMEEEIFSEGDYEEEVAIGGSESPFGTHTWNSGQLLDIRGTLNHYVNTQCPCDDEEEYEVALVFPILEDFNPGELDEFLSGIPFTVTTFHLNGISVIESIEIDYPTLDASFVVGDSVIMMSTGELVHGVATHL